MVQKIQLVSSRLCSQLSETSRLVFLLKETQKPHLTVKTRHSKINVDYKLCLQARCRMQFDHGRRVISTSGILMDSYCLRPSSCENLAMPVVQVEYVDLSPLF